jgi:hypothetical protein
LRRALEADMLDFDNEKLVAELELLFSVLGSRLSGVSTRAF